jgi:hypothetical protein
MVRRVFALAVLVCCALVGSGGARAATDELLLPDLRQEVPADLDVVRDAGGAYRLGFTSAVSNVGDGPLVIEGRRRAERGVAAMRATQLIARRRGGVASVPGVGRLRYVRSADHQHWHLLGFDRYELRGAGGVVVRDRKSGFCLGDRYRVAGGGGGRGGKVYVSRCGLRRPDLLRVREGISVGYGDVYRAHLEYQDLPLDGLAAGRYVLVHRVDADGRLREREVDNNAASVALELAWRADGAPLVTVLARCPGSATCAAPGVAARRAARAPLPLRAAAAAPARRALCRLL